MIDPWPLVERWNAARDKAPDDELWRRMLKRHTVWLLSTSHGAKPVCNTCNDSDWPCIVFREIEETLCPRS